jgi:prevent-host-death family protein
MASTQEIGVRELKAHLSACLRRVQQGEHLTVTDRGRPIATLSPAAQPASLDWAHRMVAERRLIWGGGKPVGLARPIKSRGKPASRMVLEDRR